MTVHRNSISTRAPWYQFWAKEYLTNETLAMWPVERKGALLELRAHAWLAEPPCTLPDDDRVLAKLSGLNRKWHRHSTELRKCFDSIDGDRLRDPYLTMLYEEMVSQAERRSNAGRKAAAARWTSRFDPEMAASDKPLKITPF